MRGSRSGEREHGAGADPQGDDDEQSGEPAQQPFGGHAAGDATADEHTDAVARAVDPDIFDPTVKRSTHPAAVIQIAARKHMASEAARNVLTSTDPAVHAAMLAALVRAGVLVRTTITANNATASMYATRVEVAP